MKLLAYIESNVFTISENISKTEVTAKSCLNFFFYQNMSTKKNKYTEKTVGFL